MKDINLMELYDSLLERISIPVWVETVNSEIVFVNNAYETKFKITLGEVKGKKCENVFSDELYKKHKISLDKCLKDKKIVISKIKDCE